MLRVQPGYGYDDLLLVPRHSRLESRGDVGFTVLIPRTGIFLQTPIFSAPMDTVTENEMAVFLAARGAMGIIHRYCSIDDQVAMVQKVKLSDSDELGRHRPVGAAVGATDSRERTMALVDAGVDIIAIDVAHGDSRHVLNHIEWMRSTLSGFAIMSGNIATPRAAENCISAGADILRIGIGAGSACTTRLVAGVGVPQLTAISEIAEAVDGAANDGVLLVADGGIKYSGDIVKALAAGADAVMMGGYFSKFKESPRPGQFRGMASADAISEYKNGNRDSAAEGVSFGVADVVEDSDQEFIDLVASIRQGFAYLGASNTHELQENAQWVEVSGLAYLEGVAHFKGQQL